MLFGFDFGDGVTQGQRLEFAGLDEAEQGAVLGLLAAAAERGWPAGDDLCVRIRDAEGTPLATATVYIRVDRSAG